MKENKINFRKIEKKDIKDIKELFNPETKWTVENSAYLMLGLDKLSEDELFERMVKSNAEVITRDGDIFLGVIEMVPYENDGLELRTATIVSPDIDPKESEKATEQYIISALKKYGATRIIIEIDKKQDVTIKHVLASGYKVISTINNTITFEFDFSKFNKI